MQELIAAVAEATGWPESMVERSARARAQAQGITVEAVLSAWAGGGAVDASATAAAAAAPTGEAEAATSAAPASEAAPALEVEVLETAPAAEEAPAEPEPEPEDQRRPSVPTWLAASFVIIPAIAIMYALFFPNGPECGVGAQLGLDPVSGEAESCDGSPYGAEKFDFFAAGEQTYASFCSACHGAEGAGSGSFPTLSGGAVTATFPECGEHLEWVGLGTLGWPETTYGANSTPVGSSGSVMPAFGGAFTPQELAAVVIFERVAFGGLSLPDVEADCEPDALAAASDSPQPTP